MPLLYAMPSGKRSVAKKRMWNESAVGGGTLGVFFRAVADGKSYFIKTCMDDEMCRINLHKEAEIMKILYGSPLNAGSFFAGSFSVGFNGVFKEFIIMDYMDAENGEYEMECVAGAIKRYNAELAGKVRDIVNYNTDDIYRAASVSLDVLGRTGLLSRETCRWCEKALKRVERYGENGVTLCHGDLGNANILTSEGNTVVLDWEDAVLAYREYDILYWLTFYSQRKFYGSRLFEDIGVQRQYGQDIMVLVLLVKCFLSYRDKSYAGNRLGMNDRINEIIFM